jgi:NADPH-dependent glutamate synthase beta subunit-like oxidoreductase
VSKSIVIIGSGPSGFYIADVLSKKGAATTVDILDRLPAPFGLVRGGVAPDHQGTKNIVRQFERTLQRDSVRFLGNVEVGRDISFAELKSSYDVVVVTIGSAQDRQLGIPGEDLPGVYGSWAFVGWYNGHPDYRDLAPVLSGKGLAIIGHGNVALDVARVLAKTPREVSQSDLCEHAARAIAASPVEDIYLIGRRGPSEASFTPAELGEFASLERCVPLVQAEQIPAALNSGVPPAEVKDRQKNLEILQSFIGNRPADKPLRLHFLFYAAPLAIIGKDHVEGLRLEHTRVEDGRAVNTGEVFTLPVATVVTAIGYRSVPFPGLPFDEQRGIVANTDGRVEPGVYTAGWCRRGPQGVIPANRNDSLAVAKLITEDLIRQGDSDKPGPLALDRLLRERGVRPVSYQDWLKINQAEIERAGAGKPREKFTRITDMLAVLGY